MAVKKGPAGDFQKAYVSLVPKVALSIRPAASPQALKANPFAAIYKKDVDQACVLFNKGTLLESLDNAGDSMRKKAVKTEDFRIVKMLLERVVNLSIQKVEGGAPIHYATFNGNGVVVKHLIDNEADLNFRAQSYCVLSPWVPSQVAFPTLII